MTPALESGAIELAIGGLPQRPQHFYEQVLLRIALAADSLVIAAKRRRRFAFFEFRLKRGSRMPLDRNAIAAVLLGALLTPVAGADSLRDGFSNPPADARPRVWWHWMNGNVTKEGIAKDLDWMQRIGIGGLQNFDASLNTPLIVDKRLAYTTPEWQEAFQFAAGLAQEKGLEFAIAASPGWSETGGPWVKPENAIKKLVWSETVMTGGQRFAAKLPTPPKITGPFQDAPSADDIAALGSGEHLPCQSATWTSLCWHIESKRQTRTSRHRG